MKNKLLLIISGLVVTTFLCVRISYNGGQSVSMLATLYITFKAIIKNGLELTKGDWTLNIGSRMIEICLLSTCLIVSAVFNKHKVNIILATIFIAYSILLTQIYSSIIDLHLFILSSIPFYTLTVTLISINIFNLRRNSEEGDVERADGNDNYIDN